MILYPAAALLRMRSLVGIGTKPDLLVCLASRGSQASTVATLARALGYAETSIREAGSQIARAGGARVRPEPPLAYTYRPHVLNLGELPPWRFWPQLVGFLLGASRWGEQLKTPTAFLLADEARRLMHGLRSAWTEHPFPAAYPIADPDMYPGEAFLEPFADTVETVAVWLADGLPG